VGNLIRGLKRDVVYEKKKKSDADLQWVAERIRLRGRRGRKGYS
jgi:hypothetical protein